MTNETVLFAAELPDQPELWIGIGTEPPAVPRIGEGPHSGDQLTLLPYFSQDCENQPAFGQRAKTRRWIEECVRLTEQRLRLIAWHEPRFAKQLEVDRQGVMAAGENGQLEPVAGSKSAWKPDRTGVTVEVSLPIRALPRLAAAPLESLMVWAKPHRDGEERPATVKLPRPLSFEPFGEVRKRVFETQRGRSDDSTSFYAEQPPGLSYQPGDWVHVERMAYQTFTKITPTAETLYQEKAALGDVEVGVNLAVPEWPPAQDHVRTAKQWLTIFKKAKLVDTIELPGAFRAAFQKDGEIHVISFRSFQQVAATGREDALWSVLSVAQDGSHRELLPEPCATVDDNGRLCPEGPIEVTDPAWGHFGWRLGCGKRLALTWTWDLATKRYSCTLARGPTK